MTTIIKEDTIGKRIRAARIRKDKMTQEELAQAMHVKKSTLSAYENDKVDIKGSILIELSQYLDTTPNHLLGIEDNEDSFLFEAKSLLSRIKDKRTQEILLIQLRALAHM